MSHWWQVPFAVAFPHLVGGCAMLFVRNEVDSCRRMKRPSFCLNETALAISWTVYGSMMGYASYVIYREAGGFSGEAQRPLLLYGGLNLLSAYWPAAFFFHKNRALATAIVASCVPVSAMVGKVFYDINQTAGLFFIPVVCQFTYETIINYWIWRKNR